MSTSINPLRWSTISVSSSSLPLTNKVTVGATGGWKNV